VQIIPTPLEGLLVIKPKVFSDERGYFFESYNKQSFFEAGIKEEFVQDNESLSQKGVLRGLHFQRNPYAQGKLVRVISGAVLDVAVDIRKDSITFGQHFSYTLTAAEKTLLWIPKGFAHGFVTLEDNTVFSYKCSDFYNKDAEVSLLWNDPALNIKWGVTNPSLSAKDIAAKPLEQLKELL
jgi:dTDP-4-dehydrorhamnose 3,5-epimerase